MRLRRPSRPLRVASTIAGVGLSWLVVGWVVGTIDAGTWVRPGGARPSIERIDVVAAIVSDRPASGARSDRGGPLRVLPGLVDASGSPSLPPAMTGDVGVSASPFTTGPLAFGLARRGPPPSAGR
ncbi:MAG TPA: hypothetical protein VIE12_06590 [Actinomycetota bacterium]|jgi:hypothetical protein